MVGASYASTNGGGRKRLRSYAESHIACCITGAQASRLCPALTSTSRTNGSSCSLDSSTEVFVESPTEVYMAQQEAERYRKLLVRNRWQLALMLHSNPVLRGYRGHALEVMRGRENELKDAVEKENEKDKKKKGVSLKERLARMRRLQPA